MCDPTREMWHTVFTGTLWFIHCVGNIGSVLSYVTGDRAELEKL